MLGNDAAVAIQLSWARDSSRDLRAFANNATVPYKWDSILDNCFDLWLSGYYFGRMSACYDAAWVGSDYGLDETVECEAISRRNEAMFLIRDYLPRRFAEQQARKENRNGRL